MYPYSNSIPVIFFFFFFLFLSSLFSLIRICSPFLQDQNEIFILVLSLFDLILFLFHFGPPTLLIFSIQIMIFLQYPQIFFIIFNLTYTYSYFCFFIFILFQTIILSLLLFPTHVIKSLGYNLGCYMDHVGVQNVGRPDLDTKRGPITPRESFSIQRLDFSRSHRQSILLG